SIDSATESLASSSGDISAKFSGRTHSSAPRAAAFPTRARAFARLSATAARDVSCTAATVTRMRAIYRFARRETSGPAASLPWRGGPMHAIRPLFAAALALGCTACSNAGADEVRSELRPLPSFDTVEVGGAIPVRIVAGAKPGAEVRGDARAVATVA